MLNVGVNNIGENQVSASQEEIRERHLLFEKNGILIDYMTFDNNDFSENVSVRRIWNTLQNKEKVDECELADLLSMLDTIITPEELEEFEEPVGISTFTQSLMNQRWASEEEKEFLQTEHELAKRLHLVCQNMDENRVTGLSLDQSRIDVCLVKVQ